MSMHWYAVHLALPLSDSERIKFEIRKALPLVEMGVFFDGDSFTTWGEPIEEGEYEHYLVKYSAPDARSALTIGELLYRMYAQRGLAVGTMNTSEPRYAVSNFDDWSVQYDENNL